jgi:hypothetical protein
MKYCDSLSQYLVQHYQADTKLLRSVAVLPLSLPKDELQTLILNEINAASQENE